MDTPLAFAADHLLNDAAGEIHLKLVWQRPNQTTYTSILCVCTTGFSDAAPAQALHPDELYRYNAFSSPIRRSSFLRGRYCAKQALQYLTPQRSAELCIANGVFQQPILVHNIHNLGVSIAHSETTSAAIAFPEQHPMGIDMDEWNSSLHTSLEPHWTPAEQTLLNTSAGTYPPLLFWSAKEALAKVLKTGLTLPLSILEITEQQHTGQWHIFHFQYFAQYKVLALDGGHLALALAVPAKSELIDCHRLNRYY